MFTTRTANLYVIKESVLDFYIHGNDHWEFSDSLSRSALLHLHTFAFVQLANTFVKSELETIQQAADRVEVNETKFLFAQLHLLPDRVCTFIEQF